MRARLGLATCNTRSKGFSFLPYACKKDSERKRVEHEERRHLQVASAAGESKTLKVRSLRASEPDSQDASPGGFDPEAPFQRQDRNPLLRGGRRHVQNGATLQVALRLGDLQPLHQRLQVPRRRPPHLRRRNPPSQTGGGGET